MKTLPTTVQVRDAGITFARENLKDCCADIIVWNTTGVLPNGKLRALGEIVKPLDQYRFLNIAEEMVKISAMRYVIEST